MTVTFGDAHLDTLTKLIALAEKHNMKIRFGTNNSTDNAALSSVLEEFDIPEEYLEFLDEYDSELLEGNIISTTEVLWFELFEPNVREGMNYYSVLSYYEYDVHFQLKSDWEDELDDIIDLIKDELDDSNSEHDEEETDEHVDPRIEQLENFRKWLNEESSEYGGYIHFGKSPTEIRGFGKKTITDGRVYREGMALHYFTELVCEYLKEPMIHNTY